MNAKNTLDNRGQLLLIGALVTAISLVLLVTILNTALFSLNLSAQSPAPEADNPDEYRRVVFREYDRTLGEVNYLSDEANVVNNVDQNVTLLNEVFLRRVGEDKSTIIDTELQSTTQGTWVRQETTREFTNKSGSTEDWEMMETENARRVRITVTRSNLPSVGSPSTYLSGSEATELAEQELFHIRFNSTTDNHEWNVFLFKSGGQTYIILDEDGGDDSFKRITTTSTEVNIGLTTGQINNRKGVFEYQPANMNEYNVTVYNANPPVGSQNPKGKYILVGDSTATINTGNVHGDASLGEPYQKDIVYSATLEVDYHTPQFSYTETLELKPCHPRADGCRNWANPDPPGGSSGGGGGGGSAPTTSIDSVTDSSTCTGPPGSRDVELNVDWSASDSDGDLQSVTVDLVRSGTVVDSQTYTYGGTSSASDSTTLNDPGNSNPNNDDYTVRVNATDDDSNTGGTSTLETVC